MTASSSSSARSKSPSQKKLCARIAANHVICDGAEPLALVDYSAVEQADPGTLEEIAQGLSAGAERAGVEIPGGELAELPEMLKGHPSPRGIDLVGACVGTVQLDRVITGAAIEAGDGVIGLPSTGIHSNGLTLARKTLLEDAGHELDDQVEGLERTLADELLEPTEIYVEAILELLRSDLEVHGLAHITGGGLLNLLRLNPAVGYEIDDPLEVPAIFGVIQDAGEIANEELYEAFNMGMGLRCIVAPGSADAAEALLRNRYRSARLVGEVTPDAGAVRMPSVGITGRESGFELRGGDRS